MHHEPRPESENGAPGNRVLWLSAAALVGVSLLTPVQVYSTNTSQSPPRARALLAALALVGLGLALAALVARWAGWERAIQMGAVTVLVVSQWERPSNLSGSFPEWVIPVLMWVCLVGVSWRWGLRRELASVLAVFAWVVVISSVLPALRGPSNNTSILAGSGYDLGRPSDEPRDLVIVVLDGYGRSDVLMDTYGYDNSDFQRLLEAEGYAVPTGSHANYSMTIAALASALALEPLVVAGDEPNAVRVSALTNMIRGENALVRGLRELGYRYVHFESGWSSGRCGPAVDTCVGSSTYDEYVGTVLSVTAFGDIFTDWLGHPFTHNGRSILDQLVDIDEVMTPGADFVLAHVPLPHPPMHLSASCEMVNGVDRRGGAVGARDIDPAQLDRRKMYYVEQVQCVNSLMADVAAALPPDAVVLITADHGPDSRGQLSEPPGQWSEADVVERFAIFSAIRAPACGIEVGESPSMIDLFRVSAACAIGGERPEAVSAALIYPDSVPGIEPGGAWAAAPVRIPES